jgi:hypothetical protein
MMPGSILALFWPFLSLYALQSFTPCFTHFYVTLTRVPPCLYLLSAAAPAIQAC